jgi:hypothetical protein
MHDQSAVLKKLTAILQPPADSAELAAWASMEPSIAFLSENAQADSVILHLSAGHMFVASALVPTASVDSPDWDDLGRWTMDPWSSWSVWSSAKEVGIEPPLGGDDSKTIAMGEQLVFMRTFEGVPERGTYVEVLQKLVHLLSLHYMPERDAWCRLNRHGDIEDVIRHVEIPEGATKGSGGRVVLCDRATLTKYATLTEATLVRMFDFTYVGSSFGGWKTGGEEQRTHGDTVRYRFLLNGGPASYARGVEIVPLATPRQEIADEIWGRQAEKQYASFIAYDWKNQRVEEISCSPDTLANYFTESEKPFEVTPAFFRPEVLLKYKSDREKYQLGHRSVSCRGAWHLKTFDINAEGQVHTYLLYLRDLPYEEQLHWKQYNEPPKGPISERAHKTDFKGEWSDDYDPLLSLKRKLGDLAGAKTPWWKLRSSDLPDKAHYPVTTSPDEWADEILHLDQLLVEGFDEKALRARCGEADLRIRSLGLIERCLVQYGFDDERAHELVQPLKDLHELRSKVKGHASGSDAKMLRQAAIKEHGTLRNHYQALVQKCDESLAAITTALTVPADA